KKRGHSRAMLCDARTTTLGAKLPPQEGRPTILDPRFSILDRSFVEPPEARRPTSVIPRPFWLFPPPPHNLQTRPDRLDLRQLLFFPPIPPQRSPRALLRLPRQLRRT